MQKQWRSAICWLAHHGLLILLSYRTQDHQHKNGTTHKVWALPHQSLVKKRPYSWLLWRHSLSTEVLSDESSLCQVNIKLARTQKVGTGEMSQSVKSVCHAKKRTLLLFWFSSPVPCTKQSDTHLQPQCCRGRDRQIPRGSLISHPKQTNKPQANEIPCPQKLGR